jgi:branched-chain amino acid aminotransferase
MGFMPAPPVLTFEMTDDGPVRLRDAESLAEASDLLPPGAYSTMRTCGGRGIVRFDAHIHRLEQSVALQGSRATLDREAVRRLVAAALDGTGHPESRLRLTFAPPRIFVSIEAFVPLVRSLYEEGVTCVTLPRLHRDQPHAKDTRFIATARQAYRELPDGVQEGLLVAADASILEGLSSNFFAVLGGALHTEEERVLPGITRALVLEVAEAQIPVVRRAARRDELARVREAFITSTSRGVLPVVRIDDAAIGDGRVGPATRAIMAGFAELVRRESAGSLTNNPSPRDGA